VVAVISLAEIAPAALQQHISWGILLLALVVFGSGRWVLDKPLRAWLSKR
jgi:putative oxidoreductase